MRCEKTYRLPCGSFSRNDYISFVLCQTQKRRKPAEPVSDTAGLWRHFVGDDDALHAGLPENLFSAGSRRSVSGCRRHTAFAEIQRQADAGIPWTSPGVCLLESPAHRGGNPVYCQSGLSEGAQYGCCVFYHPHQKRSLRFCSADVHLHCRSACSFPCILHHAKAPFCTDCQCDIPAH